jgi:hypothetical protein
MVSSVICMACIIYRDIYTEETFSILLEHGDLWWNTLFHPSRICYTSDPVSTSDNPYSLSIVIIYTLYSLEINHRTLFSSYTRLQAVLMSYLSSRWSLFDLLKCDTDPYRLAARTVYPRSSPASEPAQLNNFSTVAFDDEQLN